MGEDLGERDVIKLLSLSGRARVGKGTFVTLLRDILLHHHVSEIAFATVLKEELDPFLLKHLGISAFTTDDREKKLVRPYLVAHGAGMRGLDPLHWVKQAEPNVKAALNRGDVVVVSDSRYRNEVDWVHGLGGKTVYIERIAADGLPVPPANAEEAEHDSAAREASDYIISWPTFSSSDYLDKMRPYVQSAWSQLNT